MCDVCDDLDDDDMCDKWINLVEKYEKQDYNDENVRKALLKDFEQLSKQYWKDILERAPKEELAEEIANIWCRLPEVTSVVDAFEEATSYMYYASDRMNLNRWLLIRSLLNKGIS